MAKRKLIKEARDISVLRGVTQRIDSSTAIRWFQNNLDFMFAKVPKKMVEQEIMNKPPISGKRIPVNKRNIGKMFMFYYLPKERNRLPYYDRFPLVIPFHLEQNSLLGLNIHYLPPKYRTLFMERLYSYLNQRTVDETTRFRISYKILKETTKLRYAKPCIRKYDYKWMRSRIVNIPSEDWNIAVHMPTERFRKQKRTKVWADTRRQLNLNKEKGANI